MNRGIEVAERVVTLLSAGAFTATYKQAVLIAMMDLCISLTSDKGFPPTSITTRQLAERIIELYWPQTRQWCEDGDARVLAQNNAGKAGTGRATIVRAIHEFRAAAEGSTSRAVTLPSARASRPLAYQSLVCDVEWTLIAMPLPKLQRVGGNDTHWLYRINWDDAAGLPRRSLVRAYQRGERVAFDNQIRFQPGVAEAFVRLAGILRPFVLQHWAAKVAALNSLEEAKLPAFLFCVDRLSLEPVRAPLVEVQAGRCFYCGRQFKGPVEIDHFIPWARQPDNGLHNLVAAHPACNNAKRDFLAAPGHVERWRVRSSLQALALDEIAQQAQWETGEARILGIARGTYLGLPEDARLWQAKGEFVVADPRALLELLAA